jgi:oligo-1,6-glucosidase
MKDNRGQTITPGSTFCEVYDRPIGKDLLNMLFQAGVITKDLLDGTHRLSDIEAIAGRPMPGLVETAVIILNNEKESVPPPPVSITPRWWKESVVYQIYPRSFQDSNGDGIGDIAGIRQRIPYLKELGINMLWLSPIYDSPNDDMGYDIRDYKKILNEFGNMDDFDMLISDLHANGIKLIMDLVVNHTSDEHAWFQKALADPTGPEKNYYLWKKGKNGGPPNNWSSLFSGIAWNYYSALDEWAMHLFSKKQMDLNWDNADLRHEVYRMINWWLEKGVDGFRMDVISFISKATLEDGNAILSRFAVPGIEHYFYGPRLHGYLQEMRRECFERHDAFSVGECPIIGMEASKMLTAEGRGELDMVFNFAHLDNPGKSRMLPYAYDGRYG